MEIKSQVRLKRTCAVKIGRVALPPAELNLGPKEGKEVIVLH